MSAFSYNMVANLTRGFRKRAKRGLTVVGSGRIGSGRAGQAARRESAAAASAISVSTMAAHGSSRVTMPTD